VSERIWQGGGRRLALALFVAGAVALTVVAAASTARGDPKKVIVPAVQAKAKAINVKLADLAAGSGWKAKPSGPSGATPRCSYYNPDQSDLTENGDADSAEFTLPSSSFVSSSTSIFKSAAQGRTGYARVIQPKLPLCLAEIFRKGTGHPKQVTIVSAAAVKFSRLAERTNAYRVVADFKSSPKVTVRVYLDFVAMNRGKVDSVVFFAGIGGAFRSAFERSVASKVAARMATA
jgi:hypothetical protein